MFEVWQIVNKKMENNKYVIDREEHWHTVKIAEYKTEAEAKQCVIDNTLVHHSTSHINNLVWALEKSLADYYNDTAQMLLEKKQMFYNEFCFTNEKYLQYRRFFVGKPSTKDIRAIVESSGAVYKPLS